MLETGMEAPAFTLNDAEGNPHSLADYRGRKVVLYFYPKDNTAGCTAEACGFRDRMPAFEEKGAVIIGISKDTVSSHKRFAEKQGLPFVILSDPDKEVMALYDVWKEKTMYGKKVMGTERDTYVIDENGIIIRTYKKVKPSEHPQQVLEDLA